LLIVIAIAIAIASSGGRTSHHPAAASSRPGFFAEVRTLAGDGSGSLVAAYEQAETDAINRTLGYTPYIRIAGNQHREIALTFDDGPGPYTPMGELNRADQQSQLTEEISSIRRYGAPVPRLFRPPYGSFDNTTLALLTRFHMLMVLWTVDTSDYQEPGVQAIVHSAVTGARPGAIILLHDAGGNRAQTVAALPIIIRDLRLRGYKLVTVPRLIMDNPPPHDQNISA